MGTDPTQTLIVDTVADRTALNQVREHFFGEAEVRCAKFLAGGDSLEWAMARTRLLTRSDALGLAAQTPAPKKQTGRKTAR